MAQPISPISGQPRPAHTGPRLQRSLLFVGAFYGLAVIWGMRNVYYWEPSRVDLLVPYVLAIALAWWALSDARRRGHAIPLLTHQWFLLGAPVVVPGYVIWSRRWRGLGLIVLHAVGWFGLATVAMQVGGAILFGEEWGRAGD